MPRLTAERLRTALHYDPETGHFTWLIAAGRQSVGNVAGWKSRDRWSITIDGEKHQASRLAWLYMTGDWPTSEIDHRNVVAKDNQWDNLREATRIQNQANHKISRANTSGFKGVSFHKRSRLWRADIRYGGRQKSLGLFETVKEAAEAYAAAAAEMRGEFARSS